MIKYFSIPMEMELKRVGNGFTLKTESVKGINTYVAENETSLKNTIKNICEELFGRSNPSATRMYIQVCKKFELK